MLQRQLQKKCLSNGLFANGMTEEERYWVAFSVFSGIEPVRFELLKTLFSSHHFQYRVMKKSFEMIMSMPLPKNTTSIQDC